MDMFVIRGGRPLAGEVTVSGAKNAALPIMAAALAADGPCRLRSVPDLVDVRTMSTLLDELGTTVTRETNGDLVLMPHDADSSIAAYEQVRRMRASICVLGPLLGRRGQACVSLPGGCNIGHRPIDLHLKGLAALGADIRIERGYVRAVARRLKGANVYLGGAFGSTVTGTCNVLSAAVFAEGITTIEAAACEPEVVDLGRFLVAMGARIEGLGTPFLKIEGVERLTGADHTIIPDRIEAATLMIAAAITGGCITIHNVCGGHMTAVIEKLRETGLTIRIEGATAHVSAIAELSPVDCIALPYPGIPTDVQAQLTALLCLADGISIVTDKVFPDRFMHVSELLRLGARIRREGNTAIVCGTARPGDSRPGESRPGGSRLSGASVMASDLRASAALVLAALAADGESAVRRIYHLDRGYERLEDKLVRLGADVTRVTDQPASLPDVPPAESDLRQIPLPAPHVSPTKSRKVGAAHRQTGDDVAN